jgi:hypothetical protein
MPIYITQGRYTREAIKGMVVKPEDRADAVSRLFSKAGGRLIAHYLTFGEYDFLVIGELPKRDADGSGIARRWQRRRGDRIAHDAGDDLGRSQGRVCGSGRFGAFVPLGRRHLKAIRA